MERIDDYVYINQAQVHHYNHFRYYNEEFHY